MQTAAFIPDRRVNEVIAQLKDSLGEDHAFRIERGVKQVTALWQEQDGTADDFTQFCNASFVADTTALPRSFVTLERNLEAISGYYHKMDCGAESTIAACGAGHHAGGYDVWQLQCFGTTLPTIFMTIKLHFSRHSTFHSIRLKRRPS